MSILFSTCFTRWLLQQRHRNDEVGALASVAMHRPERPSKYAGLGRWARFMISDPAMEAHTGALHKAHAEWVQLCEDDQHERQKRLEEARKRAAVPMSSIKIRRSITFD